jgi:hypothetical protein
VASVALRRQALKLLLDEMFSPLVAAELRTRVHELSHSPRQSNEQS